MSNVVIRLCKRLLAWAISRVWKKEGAKVLSGNVTIGGHSVPLAQFASVAGTLIPKLVNDLRTNKTAHEIVADLESEAGPAALAAGEALANILIPGAGTAIEIVAFLIQNRTSNWTQEDENKWMDRFGAGVER